jgi:molybdopterin-binding protein
MEVAIILKSSEKITSTLSIASSKDLNLAVDLDAVL